jgi:hypothetical protein
VTLVTVDCRGFLRAGAVSVLRKFSYPFYKT